MGRVFENSDRIERDRYGFQDQPIGRRATLRADHRVMVEHHESAASGDFGVLLFSHADVEDLTLKLMKLPLFQALTKTLSLFS